MSHNFTHEPSYFGHLGWCEKTKKSPICVDFPKAAKARVMLIEMCRCHLQFHGGFCKIIRWCECPFKQDNCEPTGYYYIAFRTEKLGHLGSAIPYGFEPKSCFNWVFNSELGSFVVPQS